MNQIRLRKPVWNPNGKGWIAQAQITEIKRMAGHGVKSAHSITLRIDEVPKNSKLMQMLVMKQIDFETVTLMIDQDED